jgi:hypothetical protein
MWGSHGSAGAKPEVFCGFGPQPSSSDYQDYWSRRHQQEATLGYVLVCQKSVDALDASPYALPVHEARRRLLFNPVALPTSWSARLAPIGELPEHRTDAGALALRRYFRTTDGQILSTLEWKMARAGGSAKHQAAARYTTVADRPARLVRLQTPSGSSYVALAWESQGDYLEVAIKANRPAANTLAVLHQLAQELQNSHSGSPR